MYLKQIILLLTYPLLIALTWWLVWYVLNWFNETEKKNKN